MIPEYCVPIGASSITQWTDDLVSTGMLWKKKKTS
jgi:hypothetical protein